MKIAFIGCSSRMRIYPIQMFHMREAIEGLLKERIETVTSNCGCFYEGGIRSMLQSLSNYKQGLASEEVTFIKLPHVRPRKGFLSGWLLRSIYRYFAERYRGRRYAALSRDFDLVHFHQSADAFGYESLAWLLRSSKGQGPKTVVTVYRLSPQQTQRPRTNTLYNLADAVIVSTQHMKRFLTASGVDEHRIHVVHYGATLQPLRSKKRQGVIMFAGSPLIGVKGFDHLARALRILRDAGREVRLKLHGFYMPGHREWALAIAEKEGVTDLLDWISFASEEELIAAYQASELCAIPYTEYPGCFPVTVALANGTPVVASDAMGIPEYTDGAGLIVKAGSAEALAEGIRKVLEDDRLRARMGAEGRAVAEKRFSWETLGREQLNIYRRVLAAGEGR